MRILQVTVHAPNKPDPGCNDWDVLGTNFYVDEELFHEHIEDFERLYARHMMSGVATPKFRQTAILYGVLEYPAIKLVGKESLPDFLVTLEEKELITE